jgi:hypothetical protein
MAVFFVTAFFGATFAVAAGAGLDAGRGLGEDFAGAFFAIFVTGVFDIDFFAISVPDLRGSYVPAKIQTADRFALYGPK